MSATPHSIHASRFAPWSTRLALRAALLTTLCVWAAASLDRAAFHVFHSPQAAYSPAVLAVKWLGTLTPWLLVALALFITDSLRPPLPSAWPRALVISRRALLILASAASAGALAELLKIIFRRERPIYHDGLQMLRPLTHRPFHSGGLDLPSSHVAVAFGACCALAFLFPRARLALLVIASLVAVSRMMQGAHSLSAVTLAAALGWSLARLFATLLTPEEHGA